MLAHSSWQSWCNWIRFVGLFAHTRFFSSAHTFSMGLSSGLCDGHSCGHCPFGRPICDQALTCLEMLLQYIHIIFFPHNAIYFVKCTSPSCNKAPPQHDVATPVLHGLDGVLWLASLTILPPNITMVIIAKRFYFFLIHQTIGPFLKKVWYLSHTQG